MSCGKPIALRNITSENMLKQIFSEFYALFKGVRSAKS